MGYGTASHFATDVGYEVQRTNHFDVQITDLDIPGNRISEKIRLSVESVSIPAINLQTTELRMGNEAVKVATAPNFDSGNLVMKDTVGSDLELAFYAWFCMVYDPETGLMGLCSNYKKTTRLNQYSPDGSIKRPWKCLGVFPTTFSAGELTYANADKKLISSTMSVDKCMPER